MGMSGSDRWQKISLIFNQAVERDAADRSALLRLACGADHELRADILALLEHHDKASRLFDLSAVETAAERWGNLVPEGPQTESDRRPASTPLTPGAVLDGRYEIEERLAFGGMGEVYRARRVRLGDLVAIKVIRPKPGSETRYAERFMAEGRMCAALHHPHIVSVLDFAIEPRVGPYLVMEFLNGMNLSQRLRAERTLAFEEVAAIAMEIAAALDVAHAHGIIHRDLKPANVMAHHYTKGEIVHKLIDFGIGNLQREQLASEGEHGPRIAATLAYASPEQLTGRDTDQRSDVYSFGVTVYELLTGRRPFGLNRPWTVVVDHLFAAPQRPSDVRRDLPSWVDAAVLKALEKLPDHRWETASDFATALCGAPPTRPSVAARAASRLLDRYTLGPMIARGRLGSEIFEATDRATNEAVAIRVITRNDQLDWSAVRARFLREANTTPINHPSILRIRDHGDELDTVYIVTDLVRGRSLREVIDREAPLAWPRGFLLVQDLIGAVRALHEQGVLAFGLSPDIIRVKTIESRERLIVSAAGVAEIQDVLAPANGPRRDSLALGSVDGHYLAPELLIDEKPDGRTDLYTIGAIGYELLAGTRPYSAATLPQLVAAAFTAPIPDPRTYASDLPEAAGRCLLRCLARRPDERFTTAMELEKEWAALTP
jgi:serine/threonine protein kinase